MSMESQPQQELSPTEAVYAAYEASVELLAYIDERAADAQAGRIFVLDPVSDDAPCTLFMVAPYHDGYDAGGVGGAE